MWGIMAHGKLDIVWRRIEMTNDPKNVFLHQQSLGDKTLANHCMKWVCVI